HHLTPISTIKPSVSTQQRPRRPATSRPHTYFPAPMNPTRMILSRRIPASYQIVLYRVTRWVGGSARWTGGAGVAPLRSAPSPARSNRSSSSCGRDEGVPLRRAQGCDPGATRPLHTRGTPRHRPARTVRYRSQRDSVGLAMESFSGGGAAVGAVAHPASGALAEVMVDPRVGSGRGQKRDGLHRAHEAGLVEADADRLAGAKGEQRFLLAHVPVPVPWAHPVRDRQPEWDRFLTQQIIDVLGQGLDRPRREAVQHASQRPP